MKVFSIYIVLTFIAFSNVFAQDCPSNIDFESGSFNGWSCWTGSVAGIGNQNIITLTPSSTGVPNRHTMLSSIATRGQIDQFGGFPLPPPNGSNYYVMLGNSTGGAEAEAISYDFVIPANRPVFSLIYYYAVVFQDPSHQQFQQPRMKIEITNETDNTLISCSSFDYAPYGQDILPGFKESPIRLDNSPIWYKEWTPVTINLNNQAGKAIRLKFTTADCTFRRHFGYAYIDVNTDCSSEFNGASFCRDDPYVDILGPYGYQGYTWMDSTLTNVLGNGQTLRLTPPPADSTLYALQILPYDGYGCVDTLYTRLVGNLNTTAHAGRDTSICNGSSIQLGELPKYGVVYSWSPSLGLSDVGVSNPVANPSQQSTYILTTSSALGGCRDSDTITIGSILVDTASTLTGKNSFCADKGDSAILSVLNHTGAIQWYRDNNMINGATKNRYKATQSGNYYALLTTGSCSIKTSPFSILIDQPKKGLRYPTKEGVFNYPLQLSVRNFAATASWLPISFLDNPKSLTPIYKGNEDIDYIITLTAPSGCVTVDTQYVKTFAELKFYVPTAFTPNKDGLNDYIKPVAAGIKDIRMFRIYNRWGQLVFDLNSNARGWDGQLAGKPVESQVFIWIAEGIGIDNRFYSQKGTVTLIR